MGDRVFVSTPFAYIYALEAATGKKIWESKVSGPMRAPPAVSDGRVFALTLDNDLVALAADDGRKLWDYAGESESAGLLSQTTPPVLRNPAIPTAPPGHL